MHEFVLRGPERLRFIQSKIPQTSWADGTRTLGDDLASKSHKIDDNQGLQPIEIEHTKQTH